MNLGKGQRVLVEAAAEVMAARKDVYLLLCGYSPGHDDYRLELEARAESLFLTGIHHSQHEGVWGGSSDTAEGAIL